MCWEILRLTLLATFELQCSIVCFGHDAVHWAPRTCSSNSCKFVPFNQQLLTSSTPWLLATTNLFSFYESGILRLHISVRSYSICLSWLLQSTWVHRYLFEIVISFPSDKYREVRLLNHMLVLFLTCWRAIILFSIAAMPVYIPTNNYEGSLFSISSPVISVSLWW